MPFIKNEKDKEMLLNKIFDKKTSVNKGLRNIIPDKEKVLLVKAVLVAIEVGKVSTSLLQRRLCVGYGKAAYFIDKMLEMKYILPTESLIPHEVVVTKERLKKDIAEGRL